MNIYLKRTLKSFVIVSSIIIAAVYIYIQTLPPPPRWTTPEGQTEILQEALDNGMATEATTPEGKKVYFIGSTKYMTPHSFEEIHFSHLEGMNRHAKSGSGTSYIPSKKEYPELKFTIIPPSQSDDEESNQEK